MNEHEYLIKRVNFLLLKHKIIRRVDDDRFAFALHFLNRLKEELETKSLTNAVASSMIYHAPETHRDELAAMGCVVISYFNEWFPSIDMSSEFNPSDIHKIYNKLKFLNENK